MKNVKLSSGGYSLQEQKSLAFLIAQAAVRTLQSGTHRTLTIFVGPDGAVAYSDNDSDTFFAPVEIAGRYTATATAAEIAADVQFLHDKFNAQNRDEEREPQEIKPDAPVDPLPTQNNPLPLPPLPLPPSEPESLKGC